MLNWWNTIKSYIKRNITVARFNVIKTAIVSPPYCWLYLLQLEKAKLEETLAYFEKMYFIDHKRDIYWINICINLLDIMINMDYRDPEGEVKVNFKNLKRFYIKHGEITWEEIEDFARAHPKELYYIKASDLYYKIRSRYTYITTKGERFTHS